MVQIYIYIYIYMSRLGMQLYCILRTADGVAGPFVAQFSRATSTRVLTAVETCGGKSIDISF